MSDQALEAMKEARAVLLQEKQKGLATREGSIALTQLETAMLWRENDLILKKSSNVDVKIKNEGLTEQKDLPEDEVSTIEPKDSPP